MQSYRGRGRFTHWEPALLGLYAVEGAAARADGQIELMCPPELEAQMYYERSFLDVWPALQAICCPALLVYGSQPRPYPRAPARAVQAAIPGAKLAHVAGAGHFVPQEQPAALAPDDEASTASPETGYCRSPIASLLRSRKWPTTRSCSRCASASRTSR